MTEDKPQVQSRKTTSRSKDVIYSETEIAAAAMTAHEVIRAYCAGLGDNSQPPWHDAPEWQRESAMAGARLIANNPDTSPEATHESWLAQKKADGWKYGPAKNPGTKEHPCFVPYAELPASQRAKDTLFGAAVRGVLGIDD